MTDTPDDSWRDALHGWFVVEIDTDAPMPPQVRWNPWNKVVHDHRDGSVIPDSTNEERSRRGLPVPWGPEMGERECHQPPVW